mmetsp:Transcript_58007/g.135931  ORF Transcript_58007/g.135931 Transcript_58007/m.135931 type:complete len:219 (+) Transcript_58007:326-982(+)
MWKCPWAMAVQKSVQIDCMSSLAGPRVSMAELPSGMAALGSARAWNPALRRTTGQPSTVGAAMTSGISRSRRTRRLISVTGSNTSSHSIDASLIGLSPEVERLRWLASSMRSSEEDLRSELELDIRPTAFSTGFVSAGHVTELAKAIRSSPSESSSSSSDEEPSRRSRNRLPSLDVSSCLHSSGAGKEGFWTTASSGLRGCASALRSLCPSLLASDVN